VQRTKMSRHELKETDEITNSIQNVTEVVIARKKEVLIGLVAVVVIVGGIVGWKVYSANRTANAQSQLSQAISAFNDTNIKSDKDRFLRTLVEAEKTRTEYGSTSAAVIAQYFEAISQEGLGDTAKAVDNLQQVIKSGDETAAGIAKFALAGIYKKHGETAKAIDLYKDLYDKGGYSKSAAIYELARLSEATSKTDEAKSYYEKIVTEFPESPFRQEADTALKRLGGSVPVAVQKPS
jgi:predicted negative regulator of RcsB-dependent stress response